MAYESAWFAHLIRMTASIAVPPAFEIWHTSPCLFVISPSLNCSSCSVASIRTISPPWKKERVTQIGWWSIDSGTGTRSVRVCMVTFSPSTETSGRRKCAKAATTAIQLASTRAPSWSRKCTSARTLQHFWPATMQRDSWSIALDRRIAFSIRRVRRTSCSVDLK